MLPINSATLQVQAVHVKCHLSLKHTNSGILITFLGSLFSPAHADIYSHNHVYDFRQAHTHTHTPYLPPTNYNTAPYTVPAPALWENPTYTFSYISPAASEPTLGDKHLC